MTIFSKGLQIVTIIASLSVMGAAARFTQPIEDQSHRSLLAATITLADGSTRAVRLEGVGCSVSMCSRVAIRNTKATGIWLDGLASVDTITADNSNGPVKAMFHFKAGTDREVAVTAGNRVLYIHHGFWPMEKLDLGSVAKVEFD